MVLTSVASIFCTDSGDSSLQRSAKYKTYLLIYKASLNLAVLKVFYIWETSIFLIDYTLF